MREVNLKCLLNFLSRMSMYIQSNDRQSVVSFIVGYECGAQGECCFTNELSKKLSVEYNIQKYATGWSDQIDRYSKDKKIEWVQAFKLIGLEPLNESKET